MRDDREERIREGIKTVEPRMVYNRSDAERRLDWLEAHWQVLATAFAIIVVLLLIGGCSVRQYAQARRVPMLESHITSITAEFDTLEGTASMVTGQRDALESVVTSLQADVATMTAEIERLREDLSEATSTVKALEEDNAALKRSAAPSVSRSAPAASVNTTGWNTGEASWYGPGLYGGKTADGTAFTTSTWCVAHKTLPFGTMLEIEYNGNTVKVPVKDRGPFVAGRVLDLSGAVATALGFSGHHPVRWRIVSGG